MLGLLTGCTGCGVVFGLDIVAGAGGGADPPPLLLFFLVF